MTVSCMLFQNCKLASQSLIFLVDTMQSLILFPQICELSLLLTEGAKGFLKPILQLGYLFLVCLRLEQSQLLLYFLLVLSFLLLAAPLDKISD